jgi:hypothetical protein
MTLNLGTLSRAIRLLLGVILLGLYGALPSPWRYLSLAGAVLIATALVAHCPLYRVLGASSRPHPAKA